MWKHILTVVALYFLAACSSTTNGGHQMAKQAMSPDELIDEAVSVKREQGVPDRVKIGSPYEIFGVLYTPAPQPTYVQEGKASWYGPGFNGKRTANGERFSESDLTAAHPTLPLPSLVRVTNLDNGKQLVVRVNDRGPFSKKRIMDLSKRAAELFDMRRAGIANVRLELMSDETERLWSRLGFGAPDAWQMAKNDLKSGDAQIAFNAPVPAVTATAIPSPSHLAVKAQPVVKVPESMTISAAEEDEIMLGSDGDDKVYIQAAAYSDLKNAKHAATRLQRMGGAHLQPVEFGGQTLYRVRVGPMSEGVALETVRTQMPELGFDEARIVYK